MSLLYLQDWPFSEIFFNERRVVKKENDPLQKKSEQSFVIYTGFMRFLEDYRQELILPHTYTYT